MSYRLTMQAADGSKSFLLYDPHTSALTNEQGEPVPLEYDESATPDKWGKFIPVSPDSPGRKHAAPKRLKIQLGLQCNYACSYCLQSSEVPDATAANIKDAEEFLANIDTWLKSEPTRVEFWGGEPFVYWKLMQVVVPAIKERLPKAHMLIITNGSVLDDEKIDFLDHYNIQVAVSHDGPGQHLRGPDPFDDPEKAEMLRKLWQRLGTKGRMSFNSVLTADNSDIEGIRSWLEERMGCPISLDYEGVVHSYSDGSGNAAASWKPEQFSKLQWNVIHALVNGTPAGVNSTIAYKANAFLDSIRQRRPSSALWQKCGMDREDQLAVDLKGNVMTCQNVGANGKHGIGHVSDFDSIALDTSWHWSKRENCSNCPVLQLCGGACMYSEGTDFDMSCEGEFHYNAAVMAGALYWATGKVMVHIDGDIRRPKPRKVIPLKLTH